MRRRRRRPQSEGVEPKIGARPIGEGAGSSKRTPRCLPTSLSPRAQTSDTQQAKTQLVAREAVVAAAPDTHGDLSPLPARYRDGERSSAMIPMATSTAGLETTAMQAAAARAPSPEEAAE